MEIRTDEISRIIKDQLAKKEFSAGAEETGETISVGGNVARVYGLANAMAGELVEFPENRFGVVFNLEEDCAGIAILGEDKGIKEGDIVKRTGRIASVPAGEALLGRVVNTLGTPIDNRGKISAKDFRPLENKAPGVVERRPVNAPLYTGIKAIDSMIPIGKGQRELIIGDRQTGKTAIALDAIVAQKHSGVKCIYVAIGQKVSSVARVVDKLRSLEAFDYTTVVVANASDPAPLQYLAPYCGASLGEYYRDKGEHALVIYDDLSKHAVAYRQLSLLLRRPPGREAYPGDIFYLHSRLLERAANLSEALGAGSLTALPIIETLEGDISAYIPTNVISITDGQIYLEKDLFNAGVRPAINVGLSVSRVGGAAQTKAMKDVASSLRLDMAQYEELQAFVQFGAEVDETTYRQIMRGNKLIEILKQGQFRPLPIELQVASIFAGTSGALDDLDPKRVPEFLQAYLTHVEQKMTKEMGNIRKTGELSATTRTELNAAALAVKKTLG